MAPSTVCAQQSTQQLPPEPCQHADARQGATTDAYSSRDSYLLNTALLDMPATTTSRPCLSPNRTYPLMITREVLTASSAL
jgi:hypothetical protein